jgi:hypothetical protein
MPLLKTISELKRYASVDATQGIPPGLALGLRLVEQKFLAPLLGKPLLTWLQAQYDAPDFAIEAETLGAELVRLVQAPLARLGIGVGVPHHQVSIDATGIHFLATDTSKTAFQWQSNQLRAALEHQGLSDIDTLMPASGTAGSCSLARPTSRNTRTSAIRGPCFSSWGRCGAAWSPSKSAACSAPSSCRNCATK